MPLTRRVEPELLDRLPASDPRAVAARRDLRRVNTLMGHPGKMARALLKHGARRKPRTILDLGAGDGAFALRVARRLAPHWPRVTIVLHDRQDIVSRSTRDGFAALGWKAETASADVFKFLAGITPSEVDVVTSNLFLHHFTREHLAGLFGQAARLGWLFAACEPRRSKWAVRASRLLWAIGCNDVTVHDAVTSARAGFGGEELSALWPNAAEWELHERDVGLASHVFVARRVASDG